VTPAPAIAWAAVTIDCVDTAQVAAFWAAVLNVEARPAGPDREGWFRLGPVVRGGPVVNFQPVAEKKSGKSRTHLDLWVDDLDAAVARVTALGARYTSTEHVPGRGTIAVMADPEGNEFCLLAAEAQ
jgi:predicted enzyme related to lactoylglutathione lyase